MKFIILAFFLLMPSFSTAQTDPALQGRQAENFIRALGDEAIAALNTTMNDPAARRDKFKTILNNNFDMDTIARFTMGRYWGSATEAQKKEYSNLFRQMVIDVYTKRFSEYTNQNFKVTGHRSAGSTDYIVNSLITDNGSQPINVDWRVRRGKVIDVIVEGVSMSVTQRSEFASIIQRNGGQVSALINHLEK
jgi:phospholipid transport system substrate-binding protein